MYEHLKIEENGQHELYYDIELPLISVLSSMEQLGFTLDTAELGTGDYIVTTIAYVPDEDFDDGLRTEVQKQLLCSVTA